MKFSKRILSVLLSLVMIAVMIVPVGTMTASAAIAGGGLQGYTTHVYEGCDLSFWNVNDNDYANGYATDDSGADYSLIDFKRMKADGCDFVILRLGSVENGANYVDPHFYTYYNMAREADMDIGLYFYSHALTYAGAAAEAEFVIDIIEDAGMYFEYPLYIDIEEKDQLALSMASMTSLISGWCETMVNNNYFPGIYGNYSLWELTSSAILNTYDFWLAYVSDSESISSYNPSNTNVSEDCSMWQYSFYGYGYDGVGYYSSSAGAVLLDVNVSYKDYPAIMAQYGYNNMTANKVVSNGASYTAVNTRDDIYADNGTKLTDGQKGSLAGGESERYSGWFTDELEVTIDIGSDSSYNTFNVYAATNSSWGITSAPTGLKVLVGNSASGPFTEVAATTSAIATATDSTTGWTTYKLTASIDSEGDEIASISNRYVKFVMTAKDAGDTNYPGAGHIWLDEVEVSYIETAKAETTSIITSLEFVTTEVTPVNGSATFKPTLYSVNGDTSLTNLVSSSIYLYTISAIGADDWTVYSGNTFAGNTLYDLYFSLSCSSSVTFAADCTLTLKTADGSHDAIIYSYDASNNSMAFDIYFNLSDSADGTNIFISGINNSIDAGEANIFTPSFGTVNTSSANILWTANCLAKYDSSLGAYVVQSIEIPGPSGNTNASYTLASDEILIAVHDSESSDGSTENRNKLMTVTPGMALQLNNVNLSDTYVGSNASITFYYPTTAVESLGAKANASSNGLRFGATYTKSDSNGVLTGLGFLLISDYRLGDNELDLNYASNSEIASYVVRVSACGIEEYEEGKAFEDYTTFTFYATVLGLANYADQDIVAVPYATYDTGKIVYGEKIVNNLNGVLAGESSFE